MKKVTILVLAVIVLGGCFKSNLSDIVDNTNNNKAPDYWLSFYNYDTGKLYHQNFLNIPDAGKVAGTYQFKNTSMEITIGDLTIIPSLWPEKLYAVIDFPGARKPEDIAGVYDFPSANHHISFKLSQAFTSDTLKRFVPDSGRLVIMYDTTYKTISGEIKNFIYNKPAGGGDAVDLLNGKFKHFHLKK